MGSITAIIANALVVLAYFFNPDLRKQQERAKVWAIFNDLEEKLAQALKDGDMNLVEKISYWMKQMREKYAYIMEGKK